MRTTKDIENATNTAERAMNAGKFDTARRAVVYALTASGLRSRLLLAPSANPEALALYIRTLRAEIARRNIEAQATRNLFKGN